MTKSMLEFDKKIRGDRALDFVKEIKCGSDVFVTYRRYWEVPTVKLRRLSGYTRSRIA